MAFNYGIATPASVAGIGQPVFNGTVRWVDSLADLPAPVSGVITLADKTALRLNANLDLEGSRIVGAGDLTLIGEDFNNYGLRSTGLTGAPLVTCAGELVTRDIRLESPAGQACVDLDTGGAASWTAKSTNFEGGIGAILGDVNNVLMEDIGFNGEQALRLTTGVNTLAWADTASFVSGDHLTIEPGASVRRRMRLDDSLIVVAGGASGVTVTAAELDTERGFQQEGVRYTGAGTFVNGIDEKDVKVFWKGCEGLPNSGRFGQVGMRNNATATTITTAGVPVKIAGTTTLNAMSQRFDDGAVATDNLLRKLDSIPVTVRAELDCSLTGPNGNDATVQVYKNGVALDLDQNPPALVTLQGSNRARATGYVALLMLEQGDVVEAYVSNEEGTGDITVPRLRWSLSEL